MRHSAAASCMCMSAVRPAYPSWSYRPARTSFTHPAGNREAEADSSGRLLQRGLWLLLSQAGIPQEIYICLKEGETEEEVVGRGIRR